jgi:branched-chain amino acid transport system permease protein
MVTETLQKLLPVILAVAFVGALYLWGLTTSPATQRTITSMFVLMILVIGLYVFTGLSGVLSFGHVSFAAIGAYTSALLTMRPAVKLTLLPELPKFLAQAHWEPLLGAIAAGVLAGAVAFFAALPLMRLIGIAAGIATFAFLMVVNIVIRNWEPITGGAGTMAGVPVHTTLQTAVGWVIAVILFAFAFQESRSGLRLRAAREDAVAAAACGVQVWKERVISFTLGGVFMGIGGALYGHFLGAFTPNAFFLSITFMTLAMLVVGGIGSLAGAITGTIAVSAANELLRLSEAGITIGPVVFTAPRGSRDLVLAAAVLATLIVRPRGIMGGSEFRMVTLLGGRRALASFAQRARQLVSSLLQRQRSDSTSSDELHSEDTASSRRGE